MSTGSCRCGGVKFTYKGDPVATAVCHCLDCRKTSGSAYGISVMIPAGNFEVSGTPSTFISKAESGNMVTSHFCSKCGTTLWVDGPAVLLKFVKAGVLDDPNALDTAKPVMELYTCRRAGWLPALGGCQQKERM
ncbi:Mss4-like protein [Ilyonectria sp. MPI-CAGE-AT-0026]|nr:Mss4-like protein [Ilyonectria sp. MPI-CAGE-AT-0026]